MTVIGELQSLLGADAVLCERGELAGFIEDWRGRYSGEAACVVLPSSTAQVAAVVRACVRARLCVRACAGGSMHACACVRASCGVKAAGDCA